MRFFPLLPVTALLSVGLMPTARAATFQAIAETGPASNRVDVVVLSEGYTSAQAAKFFSDATNAFNALLSHAPLREYRAAFNGFAIFVASQQSGSDHFGVPRNTYFNSSYDALTDFIITIPLNEQGQGKVDALVQTYRPGAELSVLLVNDPVPGGSDGFGSTAIVSLGSGMSDILAHEVGHVLAGLGDEYETPYPGFPDVEEPNTTRETRREFIKWKAWIDPATPVPTPPTFEYEDAVGLFEGAHYHSAGWYRPKFDCKMNHPAVGFCEVCSEALVLAIYSKVRPVEASVPRQSALSAAGGDLLNFSVQLLPNQDSTLAVQWLTNGIPVGLSATNYSVSAANLRPGSNSVAAVVRDLTARVRTDPLELLRQTVSWTITVNKPVSELRLANPHLTQGAFAFQVIGSAPNGVAIESSANLQAWTTAATLPALAGSVWYTNTSPAGASYFRAKSLP